MTRLLRYLLVPVLLVSSAFAVSDLKQIGMIDLPGPPGFDGLAFAGNMLIITHSAANTLDIFDPVRRRIVAQVINVANPQGIAVDQKAGRVYVSCAGSNSILVVAVKGWKVERTIPLQTTPYKLALSPDGKTLYVANWRALSLSAVNLAAGDFVRTVPLGGTPASLIFDPEANVVYASLEDRQQVVAIDPNLRIVSRYNLLASQPTGLALDVPARRLFIAVRHAVVDFALGTGTEITRVPAPAGVTSLWWDAPSSTLYAGADGGYVTMIQAGGSSFQLLDEVHTDVRGQSLAFEADRQSIYMPGGRDGKSKLLILKRIVPGQVSPLSP